MRTSYDMASVRLYHLDEETIGGGATSLFYGPLAEAMAIGRAQPAEIQPSLYVATDNDVIRFLDLLE